MRTLDISKTDLAEMFREEGRLEEARDGIIEQGTEKFGPAPPECSVAIKAIEDIDRLHMLRKRILRVANWHELLADNS